MLKLGCMSLSYKDQFAGGALDLEGFIKRARELRLDGIDLHTRAFALEEPAYLRAIRKQALENGIALSYIGVSSNFGVQGQENLDEQVSTAKHWIDIAEFMGIPLVRVFAAWIPEGDTEEATCARMIPCLKEVAAYGQEKGIVVGLHNHNHGCVTRTGKDVRRIIKEVDNPYFSHILDTGQYVGSPGASGARGQEDPSLNFYGSIKETAPMAVHVRCKIYRIQSGTEDWLDYPRIFEILKGVDYNGWCSIVYEGQDVEAEATAVPKAVNYLRSLMTW
ncbi:MAG: sugar phosphate isomerase/epimerase family protein [Candidatus Latescibacterota bacterium]|nr:sugar phosphate isomerase/epimerase family protein [Candidatus Latescibacterota bacterium]